MYPWIDDVIDIFTPWKSRRVLDFVLGISSARIIVFFNLTNDFLVEIWSQTKIAADDILSFEENKAWCFKWILCLAENSLETSSLIFSEKQWKNIYECRLLAVVIGALRVKAVQQNSREDRPGNWQLRHASVVVAGWSGPILFLLTNVHFPVFHLRL